MNTGFEITTDDIAHAIESTVGRTYPLGLHKGKYKIGTRKYGTNHDTIALNVFDELDETELNRVEKAALYGNDIDTQRDYAHQEIVKILIEKEDISIFSRRYIFLFGD